MLFQSTPYRFVGTCNLSEQHQAVFCDLKFRLLVVNLSVKNRLTANKISSPLLSVCVQRSNFAGTCRYNVVSLKYIKRCVEVLKCQGMTMSDVEQTAHFLEAQNNAERNRGTHKHFVGTKIRNFMEKFRFVHASFYAPCIHVLESMVSPARAYIPVLYFFYAS